LLDRAVRLAGGAVATGSLLAGTESVVIETARAAAPVKQLVVAQPADIVTMDSAMYRSRETQNVHQLIYDSLVHRDDNLRLVGRLAESWQVVDDRTYRFRMRGGARFQNGRPVTSHDVKFTYDRTLDPALKAPRAGLLDMVESTEAPDDATVIVRTKQRDPLTLVFLNYHAILPAAEVQAKGQAFFDNPFGAGPFQFVEWRKNDRVVLKGFPGFWGGTPSVDTLIIRAIPDPATMIAELEAGGVDVLTNLPPEAFDQIKNNPRSGY
jgi:peptide/nickel transport system substrate-binding protein